MWQDLPRLFPADRIFSVRFLLRSRLLLRKFRQRPVFRFQDKLSQVCSIMFAEAVRILLLNRPKGLFPGKASRYMHNLHPAGNL